MARTTRPLIAWTFAAAAAASLAFVPAVWAQTMDRDPPPKSETEGQAPPSTAENPSQQLDRQKGVIQPPQSVDPEMQVTPPAPSGSQRMPVIPPPGSPGGDQTIQPK